MSSYDKMYEANAVLNLLHEVAFHFIELKRTFSEIKELNWQCLEIICAYGLLYKYVFRDEFEYEQITDSILKLKDSIFIQQRNESPLKFFESDTYCMILVSGDVKELARIQRCNKMVPTLIGYTAEELISQKVNILVPEPVCSIHEVLF